MLITLGFLAHVDAGKTTLCERILYQAHALRRLGRVDAQSAFLDSDPLERQRGITIFASEAGFVHRNTSFTLLDTPGHVDFSSEMERVLSVLDCAVVVVSAVEGIQPHTETIWQLLSEHNIPTFFFLNKTDRPGADPAGVLASLKARFSPAVCDLSYGFSTDAIERIAESDDDLLVHYFEEGYQPSLWLPAARRLVAFRRLFPCFCGSALSGEGVEALMDALSSLLAPPPVLEGPLQARAFRVRYDAKGVLWVHLRILQGSLAPKQVVGREKVHELRIFQGDRSQPASLAKAGEVCAVSGLSLRPGGAIGLPGLPQPRLQPALSAEVLYPDDVAPQRVAAAFGQLEDEDPLLRVAFDAETHRLHIQLMGKIQLEVLSAQVPRRFGFPVSFGPCRIVYRETIAKPVCGYGHFEPLRHYAEVHFQLTPAPRGSGLSFDSVVPTDTLPLQFQRLIRTHVFEAPHPGVLTGAALTDVRITLTNGRAHEKHTEGGDFRQAVCRAIRQGLEQAESLLLEPYYAFSLALPLACVGHALSDLQRRHARFDAPQPQNDRCLITGRGPAACLMDYAADVAAYSKGEGALMLRFDGYDLCHNPEEVIQASGYDRRADSGHPSSSVFCSHGAGFSVAWDEVASHLHCQRRPLLAES